jgi:diguanylate cyclase (GGDEF)-like protein/PAS domain S-box-containing protein
MNPVSRLRSMMHSLWTASIRRQLVWAFGLALALMTLASISFLLAYQRNFLYQQSTEHAFSLTRSLAASSVSWVLADDVAGLQEVVNGLSATPDLEFAAVLSLRGEVLASTRPEQAGLFFRDKTSQKLLQAAPSPQILLDQPHLLDIAVPVMAGNRPVGWVRVELTRASANANLRRLQEAGVVFAAIALAVIVLIANLLAQRLTRRLTHLMTVAEESETGHGYLRATLQGDDEIGILARRINRMLDALDEQKANLRIAAITFESQQGVIVTDPETLILRANQSFIAMTGYGEEELVGETPRILQSGRQSKAFYAAMWDEIERTGAWQGEIWNRRKDGAIAPEWLTLTAVKGASGKVTHYVGTYIDITARKAAEEEIRLLAFYDPLTGLPNRRLQRDRLQQAVVASGRSGQYGAVLFIDLDNFKMLNDTLGHDLGDVLLQQVAGRLTKCVRQGDSVARLGGDEFVVMLEDLSGQAADAAAYARQLGEKILATLNHPYDLSGQAWHSTPSIGITLFGVQAVAVDELMKQADLAMYQAKLAGRNTVRFFDQDMQRVVSARAELTESLRVALVEQQFILHYQPQVDGTGRVIGAEALVRWEHPQRGRVSPADFIPAAEESGLIVPLGSWVLETACRQLAAWAAEPTLSSLVVAVNVSARQFGHPDFIAQVKTSIAGSGVNPQRLKLELTESLLVDNVEATIAKMTVLKALGVSFALDDFGTGYSSLSYLKRLPLDQLKIDQSFVRDVLCDRNDAAIARTIVALGQSLGLSVIAEGVETEAQREFLAHHGCPLYQGYLFSRPVPAAEFVDRVRESRALPAG